MIAPFGRVFALKSVVARVAIGAAALLAVTTVAGPATGSPVANAAASPATPSWSAPTTINPPRGGVPTISCPTATFCMVVDQSGNAIRYQHGHAAAPVRVDTRPLAAVSCSGPAACFAADDKGYLFRFNGSRWSDGFHVARTGIGEFPVISCPYLRQCTVGFGGKVYHWNGTHWSGPHTLIGRRGDLTGISCPQRDFCAAVAVTPGDGTFAFRYDGERWGSIGKAFKTNQLFASVACSGPRFCAVASDEGSTSIFDGRGWRRVIRHEHGDFRSVSCATAKSCVAVGSYGINWRWDGSHWRHGERTRYARSMDGVSCPIDGDCLAIDQLGYLVRLTGHGWQPPRKVDPTGAELEAMACATRNLCFAADEDGNVTRFDGTTWHAPQALDPHADPGLERKPQLSCAGPSLCLLVDWRGYTTRWNGTRWIPAGRVRFGAEVELTCAGEHWCMAIGAVDGPHGTFRFAYSTFATSWHEPVTMRAVPGEGVGYFSFSCAGPDFCMLIYQGREYSVFHGARWSHLQQVTTADGHRRKSLGDASCPSDGHCVLSPSQGDRTLRFDHGTWSRRDLAPDATSGGYLVCAAPTWCLAQDEVKRIDYFDGSHWSVSSASLFPPPDAPQDPSWDVTAIACAAESHCFATDGTRVARTV